MGYCITPDMTSERVVCQKPCTHKDCAAMRRDFLDNAVCKICGKPIKSGEAFFYQEQGKTDKVHFICSIKENLNG